MKLGEVVGGVCGWPNHASRVEVMFFGLDWKESKGKRSRSVKNYEWWNGKMDLEGREWWPNVAI